MFVIIFMVSPSLPDHHRKKILKLSSKIKLKYNQICKKLRLSEVMFKKQISSICSVDSAEALLLLKVISKPPASYLLLLWLVSETLTSMNPFLYRHNVHLLT